ncbi:MULTISPECIES: sugar phosphate nucleotidyltransferase [unclassified Paenibacillus]|uniref:sugar phosphate nucleotidyltransferase n=1 Tax=unclassified Paenibacillus TaxID=185978 RepID=UPI0036348599
MSKRAIILAGGLGSRLRPYTVVLPKPLMPIGDYPILEVIIRQLINHDFSHITLAVNHQADIIKAFFKDGSKWGINIDYSIEDRPLSTMGPLKLINDLPNDFLIMNGDVLTDLNFSQLFNSHLDSRELFTISAHERDQKIDYGVLEVNDGYLTNFIEKPTKRYNVSMGIYIANRGILDFIPENKAYGFDNLMYDMLLYKRNVNVKKFNGYWLDIGRPDDYMQAIEEFDKMKSRFLEE